MKTCNVVFSDHSPLYEHFTYPGGESQIRLVPHYADAMSEHVSIVARQPDLMKLALLVNAIKGLYPENVMDLILPYLPYGRADRRFVDGDCYGLDTFGTMLGAIGFNRILTLDAHSSKASLLIKGLVDVPATPLIYKAICRFAERHKMHDVTVLFPDKGACDRYCLDSRIGNNHSGININVLHCDKQRDPATGRLLGFDVPAFDGPGLIVDDICDGGGTFLGIAANLPGQILGLYVTHGIFSQGFDKLHRAFDIIYTTDSFNENISTLDVAVFNSINTILSHKE